MAASKTSTQTSRPETADTTSAGARPADTAGMQQVFEQWLNAWRSVADPAHWAKLGQQLTPQTNGASAADGGGNGTSGATAANPFAGFAGLAGLAGVPGAAPFTMPPMPDFAKLGTIPDFSAFASQIPGLQAIPGLGGALPAMPQIPNAAIAPERLQQLQNDYSRDVVELLKQASAQSIDPGSLKDRRFSTTAWQATPAYAFTAAWYLLNARYLQELAEAVDTDPKTRERIRFAVQQWTAAASPSNFLAFNPEAQKTLIESKGESLWQGMMNLLNDMQRGKISQTDESRFEVGRNVGATRRLGRVRERSAPADPIQAAYGEGARAAAPDRAAVHQQVLHPRPAAGELADPPCARCGPSGVRPVVAQRRRSRSRTRPGTTTSSKACSSAIDIVQADHRPRADQHARLLHRRHDARRRRSRCSAARGEQPAASMTLLTTLLDFTDTGILDVFVDEAHVQMREQTIGGKNGAQPGLHARRRVRQHVLASCARTIWCGTMSSTTTSKAHAAAVRPAVLEQRLHQPARSDVLSGTCATRTSRTSCACPTKLTTCGEPVDLSRIDVPTFIYGSREDHIVPWKSAYASAPLLTGPQKFRARRVGAYRGRDQPAVEEQAQPLDSRHGRQDPARRRGRVVRRRGRSIRAAGGPTGRTGSTALPARR